MTSNTLNRVIDDAQAYMNNLGYIKEEDYDIYEAGRGKDKFIRLCFRLKGNRNIIKDFKQKGWIEGKRYRNASGNPSFYSSDMFGRGCSTGVYMVSMEYPIAIEK